MTAISTIRNLGPAFEAVLIPACFNSASKAGINTAEELREIGADAAYAQLLQAGIRPHFIAYYVLHMALHGQPAHLCTAVS